MAVSSRPRGEEARARIIEAATTVFLAQGFRGATTDQVAAQASMSKQTLYRHFPDKETLFAEVIEATTLRLAEGFADIAAALEEPDDVRTALRDLADGFFARLLQPQVIALRRLVIAEADRFPTVGRAWYDQALHRSLVVVGEGFARLQERGMLQGLGDPTLAAYEFSGLLLYLPQSRVMFAGSDAKPSKRELNKIAGRAVDVFLAAYGT